MRDGVGEIVRIALSDEEERAAKESNVPLIFIKHNLWTEKWENVQNVFVVTISNRNDYESIFSALEEVRGIIAKDYYYGVFRRFSPIGKITVVKDYDEAIRRIEGEKSVVDDWKKISRSANCKTNGNISKDISFIAKVYFCDPSIWCEKRPGFDDMNKKLNRFDFTGIQNVYTDEMEKCSGNLITKYKSLVNKGGGRFGPNVLVEETCPDCNVVYVFHLYCEPENEKTLAIATGFVDGQSGNVYY
jgi:hypothetical protein